MRTIFIQSVLLIILIETVFFLYWKIGLWTLTVLGPYIIIGIHDMLQSKHSMLKNFPVFGWGRYFMEFMRPKIYQYFVESDIDGRPISRIHRSLVYQRAKGDIATTPFGTQLDVNEIGYEWMNHSISAKDVNEIEKDMRTIVGGDDCSKKYSACIFNISAMSYGSLSKNAIEALNKGAKAGNFAHNTGEGGISPYHLNHSGDLIWQIGTGYFGCRDNNGKFCIDHYQDNSSIDSVKMIELKLSQGAKPGHGGILPGKKNTPEIAKIRGVKPYEPIISPPFHTAFKTPIQLLEFLQSLRKISDGKPVGFKFCVGNKIEFITICKAMIETEIYPDFITVDGGEGGTGAAPLEYSNSIGMPLNDGLSFVVDCLRGFNLKQHIKIIASGKTITGFHIIKNAALGADMASRARAMMLALGCIQALECNKNICPTGVATQDPDLMKGLDVNDKYIRVMRYHKETVKSVRDLLSATGHVSLGELNRYDINRRVSHSNVNRYDEIYPIIEKGSFINGKVPENLTQMYNLADKNSFIPSI